MIPKNILAQLNAVLGENYSPKQVTMYKQSFDPVNYKNDHFVFVSSRIIEMQEVVRRGVSEFNVVLDSAA